MIKRLSSILLLSFIACVLAFGQISEGGIPPSFKLNVSKSLGISDKIKVEVDKSIISSLLREEAFNTSFSSPSSVATVIPVSYNLLKDGVWTILNNGSRICRLTLTSPGALGIILSYDKFYIPKNNKLFIYNKDKSQILGAYTCRTNPEGGKFSTELVYGDELTLEYVEESSEPAEIIISGVGHGFQNIVNYKDKASLVGFNKSGNCQVNVNCSEGANWQLEKKGVARIYALIGKVWYRGTGSLVNNTRNDKSGLMLTATHVIIQKNVVADMETIQFYFNYEFSGCANENIDPESYKTLVGADLLAQSPFHGGSDGALLKLRDDIPDDYDVYFNGWTISEQQAKSGVVIHHPQGDVKKISTYTKPLVTDTYYDSEVISLKNAHWRVTYSATINGFGTTEGGSSGAPIFNENKLIVGTLSGGESSCSKKNAYDFYGKLLYHWDKGTASSQFMKPYLDPLGLDVIELKGIPNIEGGIIEPPIITPSENAPEVYGFWSEDRGRNELTVVVKNEKEYVNKINIVSIGGYEIYRKTNISHNTVKIITTGWPNGLYLVHLETSESRKLNFKIVK